MQSAMQTHRMHRLALFLWLEPALMIIAGASVAAAQYKDDASDSDMPSSTLLWLGVFQGAARLGLRDEMEMAWWWVAMVMAGVQKTVVMREMGWHPLALAATLALQAIFIIARIAWLVAVWRQCGWAGASAGGTAECADAESGQEGKHDALAMGALANDTLTNYLLRIASLDRTKPHVLQLRSWTPKVAVQPQSSSRGSLPHSPVPPSTRWSLRTRRRDSSSPPTMAVSLPSSGSNARPRPKAAAARAAVAKKTKKKAKAAAEAKAAKVVKAAAAKKAKKDAADAKAEREARQAKAAARAAKRAKAAEAKAAAEADAALAKVAAKAAKSAKRRRASAAAAAAATAKEAAPPPVKRARVRKGEPVTKKTPIGTPVMMRLPNGTRHAGVLSGRKHAWVTFQPFDDDGDAVNVRSSQLSVRGDAQV